MAKYITECVFRLSVTYKIAQRGTQTAADSLLQEPSLWHNLTSRGKRHACSMAVDVAKNHPVAQLHFHKYFVLYPIKHNNIFIVRTLKILLVSALSTGHHQEIQYIKT